MSKVRLDLLVFNRGLADSREKAKALIMEGNVYVNGIKQDKAGAQCDENAKIELKDTGCPFVSRGGLKLQKALQVFNINVEGFTALDIGASTGGFTDCLLKHNARKVYSVDVGYNQLAYSLRCDERVIVFEKTNFRYFEKENITDNIDIVVMDVSFISITKLCENILNFINEDTDMVFLIKPQFEAEKNSVGKNGVIADAKSHSKIVKNVVDNLYSHGYYLRELDFSPIKGPKGNIEFISRFSLKEEYQLENVESKIDEIVKNAHEAL